MQPRIRELVPAGVEECWLDVDGCRVRYLTAGRGPTVLLIHGLMGFSFSWTENILPLSQYFRVLAPDLPNMGQSARVDCDASLAGLGRFLWRFLDTLGVQSADLVGSSHGGAIALMMAAEHPARTGRLILANPAHPWSEAHRLRVHLWTTKRGAKVATWFRRCPFWLFQLVFETRMYGRRAKPLPGTSERYWEAMRAEGSMEHVTRILRTWFADFAHLREEIARLDAKDILLIWGQRDPIVRLRTAKYLIRRLPRSTMAVIPRAGHLPYEESPEEFNRIVLEWMQRSEAHSA